MQSTPEGFPRGFGFPREGPEGFLSEGVFPGFPSESPELESPELCTTRRRSELANPECNMTCLEVSGKSVTGEHTPDVSVLRALAQRARFG